MSKSDGKGVLAAIIVGAAAGYVAGVLTAPKSGKETREDLKKSAEKYKQEAAVRLQDAKEDLSKLVEDASEKAQYYSEKGKKEVSVLVDKAKLAQNKAKDVLHAVKRGEAEDKDLQSALTEASEAKKHLVDYLKKS